MRILILFMLLAIAFFQLLFIPSTLAEETTNNINGGKIFSANCASCHIGGGNILIAEKTLKKEALQNYLEDYNTQSLQAIIYQVQNGKNAMPAFKNKLNEQEIFDVANYVFQNAEQGW